MIYSYNKAQNNNFGHYFELNILFYNRNPHKKAYKNVVFESEKSHKPTLQLVVCTRRYPTYITSRLRQYSEKFYDEKISNFF